MKIFMFLNGYMNDIVPTLLQQSKLYMELEMPTTWHKPYNIVCTLNIGSYYNKYGLVWH
jgi:hypothetical protein